MSSIKPPSSTSRLPQLSRFNTQRPKVIKRQLSDETLPPSEKRTRLSKSSNSSAVGSCESLQDSMVGISQQKRVPRNPTGKLRRSVSMASIASQNRAGHNAANVRKPGYPRTTLGPSTMTLGTRSQSVTGPGGSRTKPGSAGSARVPVANITNRINSARSVSKIKEETNTSIPKETVKGKTKRAPWDLRGKLMDMEEILKNNCAKISDYDSRMASLEAEKMFLCQNLEQTKTYSVSAQEEINQLKKERTELVVEKQSLENRIKDLEILDASHKARIQTLENQITAKTLEADSLKSSVSQLISVKSAIEAEYSSTKLLMDTKTKCIQELEEKNSKQAESIAELNGKLMEAETTRRKLHNLVQELKGNIRVFCRVRPFIGEEVTANGGTDHLHHFNFLDEKSLELMKKANLDGSSVTGLRNRNNYEFSFDRVFTPRDSQTDVFEEISQFVQSALDGYNVCVFAYGQTGSGKTFTMEGVYDDESLEGMIPRTVKQIFRSMEELQMKGWTYTVEASFLEIYNETIRDLLASPREAKSTQYEIKLVDGKRPDIYVSNLKVVKVETASRIHQLLSIAQQHRAVAATNMNERSSRSHSVFQLKLKGRNEKTLEVCEGTLNLVDLAGSERLKESGSEGARLTETQNINKSLANLGNVIMALAEKQSHIPYRNSKLTHLLQTSLGGNSKTLMFVNVSPVENCLNESLNSLRFATKVNQCHIGTAVRQIKK